MKLLQVYQHTKYTDEFYAFLFESNNPLTITVNINYYLYSSIVIHLLSTDHIKTWINSGNSRKLTPPKE